MNKKIIYVIFGLILLFLRLIFNFESELIPGINGGYYPLQVRTLIETGHLGFSDMPLFFYLNAFFVKILLFFVSGDIDELIINTSKIIDSISLPLLVIPLYLIANNILEKKLPNYLEIILAGFATLSFSPLILTSDLQKNAFAIPLMLFFIYFLSFYLKNNSKKYLMLLTAFFVLIGLTHFGVFLISILILITSLLCFYRRRALFPILGILAMSMIIIFIFDPDRAIRLFDLWSLIFERPVILHETLTPIDLIIYAFSYLLIILGIYYIVKHKQSLNTYQINSLLTYIFVAFILSFPLIDMEYAKRFRLLLFIPQIVLLSFLFHHFTHSLKIIASIILVLITTASLLLMTGNIKPPSITQEAYQDLRNIKPYISKPNETLIIARHGLEWWTAWQLRTKIGQDKSVDKNTFLKYEKVINLMQLNGINQMHPGERNPMQEPYFPTDNKPIYVSNYFMATELDKEDLEK